MLLCVDAGNSSIKLGLVEGSSVLATHRIALAGSKPPSFRALFPPRFLKVREELTGVAVSSVVPPLNSRLNANLRRLTGVQPFFVSGRVTLPFKLDVTAPSRLGSDRIAAAAGAMPRVKRGAFIVDAGSAITVDLLSRKKYRGGIIMAGPELALAALSRRTANLPAIDFGARALPQPMRIDDTRPALLLGAAVGAIGAITEALNELTRIEGRRLPVYITGGALSRLQDRIPQRWRRDPHLVLSGLALIWRLNHS